MQRRVCVVAAVCAVVGCGQSSAEQAGVETSPCIDGECLGELACRSDVCVRDDRNDDGSDNADDGTGGGNDEASAGPDESDAGDDGPIGDATDDGTPGDDDGGTQCGVGGLPQGSTCNPALDECEPCSRCGAYLTSDPSTLQPVLAHRCEPRPSNPVAVDEPCTVPLAPDEYDPCIDGSACFPVSGDGQGACRPRCVEGVCGAGQDCFNAAWCLARCDIAEEQWQTPASEACPSGSGCYLLDLGTWCLPTIPTGVSAWGDPCMGSPAACSAGFVCEIGYLVNLNLGEVCKQMCRPSDASGCVGEPLEGYEFRCLPSVESDLPSGVGVCEYVPL